ncbi:MAG: hypothetical protein QOG49_742, partial [Frankiaceae bacterium]|nr:hypothetical protein [Frankiaceae bacterium]
MWLPTSLWARRTAMSQPADSVGRMPAKVSARSAYTCSECGCGSAKWVGRCPECQAWGTLAEVGASQIRVLRAGAV